jgi:hypothetical protein
MEIYLNMVMRRKPNRLLSTNTHMNKFAQEFCHEFNTRVSFDGDNFHNKSITLEMPNGMRIGELSVTTSNGNPVYIADMPSIISKDRSSKWSGSDGRDSEKLSNLIRTIKKNKEQPTEAKVVEMFNSAIYHAIGEITSERDLTLVLVGLRHWMHSKLSWVLTICLYINMYLTTKRYMITT